MSRSHSQLGRIARLLEVAPDELDDLAAIPETDLRTLHDQISLTLFADGHHRFARVAGLSKALPGPVAGKLAERFLPAVLAARVSELLEPAKAADLVNRVSIRYLGDIAVLLDPVRSKPVAQAIPAARVGAVARELFRRKEYAAMAEFAGTVTLDALYTALGAASPHDLLAVVPLLVWNDNIDTVVANLPAGQVRQIVAELDQAELADLALALDPSRFGPIVHAVPSETVEAIAREMVARGELAAMARFVDIVTPEVLTVALSTMSGAQIGAVLPEVSWTDNLTAAIDRLTDDQVDTILSALSPVELAELALAMDPSRIRRIVSAAPADTVAAVADELFGRREYPALARFVGVVAPDTLVAAIGAASGHDLLAVVPFLDWNDNLDHAIANLPAGRIDALLAEVAGDALWEQANLLFDKLQPSTLQAVLSRATDVTDVTDASFATLQEAATAGKLTAAAADLLATAAAGREGRDSQ